MEFTKEDLEAMFVKKNDFDSVKTQLTEEIKTIKEICKDRNKRHEIFIKHIDEDLTNLRIEGIETRSEITFLKENVKEYGTNLVKLWHVVIEHKAESNEGFSKLGFWMKINTVAMMVIILMMLFSKSPDSGNPKSFF
jgi:hypothetical protein